MFNIEKEILNTLKNILSDIFNENYRNADVGKLVQISRTIVTSYFRNTMSSVLYLCQKHGISITDIAVDCIAEIFEKDKDNRFYKLDSFFSALRMPITEIPEKEAFLAWKGLLIKLAQSHTAHMYAQFDPAGFRIQRNIKETVPATGYFYLHKNVAGVSLIIPGGGNNNLPSIHAEDIESEFLAEVKDNKKTRELLKILHNVIYKQEQYRKEIKLSEAVKLFKRVFNYVTDNQYNDDELAYAKTPRSFSEEFEVDQICDKVLKIVKEKILLNYFVKGRLTAEQSDALYLTICDLVFDWSKTGGNHSSLYEYFSGKMEMQPDDYNEIIKDKIEYLIKIAKKEFSFYLISKE